ncbi:MAG: CHC2 zinc finger domain-containing protein, partial [Phototrophicaceae bacterium]
MSVTEEIKARLDIVSYIQQQVPLKKSGRYYKACCPFHAERTPSFVVYPDRQTWRCYGSCAEGGDIFSFAMKLHGWTFAEALRELGRVAGVEVEKQTPAQRQQFEYRDRLRGVLKMAADYYHKQLVEPASDAAHAAL